MARSGSTDDAGARAGSNPVLAARLLLPRRVRRIALGSTVPDWSDLDTGDLELSRVPATTGTPPELVIGSRADYASLPLRPSAAVIYAGAGPRPRSAGPWRRFLALPSARAPAVYVPVDDRDAVERVFRTYVLPRRPSLHPLTPLAGSPARRLVALGRERTVSVSTAARSLPFPLAAAQEIGIDTSSSSWFLRAGNGLPRDQFNLFHASSTTGTAEDVVVRVANFADQGPLLAAQERGRIAALEAGSVVARHVPRHLGRFSADGLPATVEEAAAGMAMRDALATAASSRPTKLALVAAVCAWLEEVASDTRTTAAALEAPRRRIRERILPEWVAYGARIGCLDQSLDGIVATFEHGDLHPGNVVGHDATFRVIDFNRARGGGFPLWDLWFFLAHALVLADTAVTGGVARAVEMLRLFRGELPSSSLLYEWTHRVAAAAGVPMDAVGPLATLLWLDRALPDWLVPTAPDAPRPGWVEGWSAGSTPIALLLRRQRSFTVLAAHWLADPALGTGWTAFRRGS